MVMLENKNQNVIMILDALDNSWLIGRNWRQFFDSKRNLLSCYNEPLDLNSMYRSLSGAKKSHPDWVIFYKFLIRRIANMR